MALRQLAWQGAGLFESLRTQIADPHPTYLEDGHSMGKLKKLVVHQFRKVAAETTLELADGFNVVLGRNATGKTTLLMLAAAADAFDFNAFLDEPFDVTWERSGPDGSSTTRVTNRIEREFVELPGSAGQRTERKTVVTTLDVNVTPVDGGVPFQVLLDRDSARLLVEDEEVATSKRVRQYSLAIEAFFVAMQLNGRVSARVSVPGFAAFPPINDRALRMDESTEHLRALLATTVVVLEGMQGVLNNTLVPAPLLGGFMALGTTAEPQPLVQFESTNTPFLADVAATLGFESASMHCDLVERRQESGRPAERRYGNLRFLFTDTSGDVVGHQHLSYGQKRMLSFLCILADRKSLLACDELVNGLHHEWIELALTRMKGRQALLTSQNPLLMDHLRFASVDEVRRSFIVCERREIDAGFQLVWRNLNAAESADFFDAYEVGIQRVSDILVTRGFW